MILKFKLIKYIIIFYFITQLSAYSEIVKKIEVKGNERISSDTMICSRMLTLTKTLMI